jgi:hypothetical protein
MAQVLSVGAETSAGGAVAAGDRAVRWVGWSLAQQPIAQIAFEAAYKLWGLSEIGNRVLPALTVYGACA